MFVWICGFYYETFHVESYLAVCSYVFISLVEHCDRLAWGKETAVLNLIFHFLYLSPMCEEFARINHIFASVTYTHCEFCDFNKYEYFANAT